MGPEMRIKVDTPLLPAEHDDKSSPSKSNDASSPLGAHSVLNPSTVRQHGRSALAIAAQS